MDRFYSLSTITRRVGELLGPAMRTRFWIKAEVSSVRERGGTLFLDLAESDEEGKIVAQMRCMIWESDCARIRSQFIQQGLDLKVEEGSTVGIDCRLSWHPVYGISLQGRDMDPGMALGDLELRRRKILEKCKAEELLELNSQKGLSLLPRKIGLITSEESAASKDFIETLKSSPHGFQIYLADARMQGEDTEPSVLEALSVLSRLDLDLVVICRGGGSRLDLSWLDNEWLARAIAMYPIQVWTGIGHEIDTSVLDYVSAKSFKTPTAVSEELVARFSNVESRVYHAQQRLLNLTPYIVQQSRLMLNQSQQNLRHWTMDALRDQKANLKASATIVQDSWRKRFVVAYEKLAQSRLQIQSSGRRVQEKASTNLEHFRQKFLLEIKSCLQEAFLEKEHLKKRFKGDLVTRRFTQSQTLLKEKLRRVRTSDPRHALKRGFALLRNEQGQMIQSSQNLRVDENLYIELKDGQLESRITKVEQNDS